MPRRTKNLIEESLTDRLPIDVLPASNEEFVPPEPTPEQRAIMKIAREECERQARRHGLSRRRFLQAGAAYTGCLWAIVPAEGRWPPVGRGFRPISVSPPPSFALR